jgi:ABC-2 type transport system ATP-binding protein
MPPLVVVENLVKTYRIAQRQPGLWGAFRGVASRQHRTITALDGISFELEKGELVGYIGPNGAGKSTTVKLLSGIVVPDSGRCEVAGRVPWRDRIDHVAGLGVVFGQRPSCGGTCRWSSHLSCYGISTRCRCPTTSHASTS